MLDTLKTTAKVELLEPGVSLDAKRPALGASGDRALPGAKPGEAPAEAPTDAPAEEAGADEPAKD